MPRCRASHEQLLEHAPGCTRRFWRKTGCALLVPDAAPSARFCRHAVRVPDVVAVLPVRRASGSRRASSSFSCSCDVGRQVREDARQDRVRVLVLAVLVASRSRARTCSSAGARGPRPASGCPAPVGVKRPVLMPTISAAGVSGTLSTTARLWAKFWFIEPRSYGLDRRGPLILRTSAASDGPLVIASRAEEPPRR